MSDASSTDSNAETSTETSGRPEDEVEMGFLEHFAELRKRLIYALLGMVPGVIIAWGFREEILSFLVKPFAEAWQKLNLGTVSLHFAHPADPLIIYMKNSVILGLLIAAPWIFWQVWAFIAPGLYKKEKRFAIPFVLASTLCFSGGAMFGYAVVFPLGYETFLSFSGSLPELSPMFTPGMTTPTTATTTVTATVDMVPTIMITELIPFSNRMLLAFGVVFEVPVVVTFLAATGIVNWRQLLSFSRWWVVCAAVISALLTPPDIASQLLMLVPLVVLYYISVLLAFLISRKKKAAVTEA